MENLVFRDDLFTLKEITLQIKSALEIDIEDAADMVLAGLREHQSSIQLWEIPARGLPFKYDNSHSDRYSSEWLNSLWWDEKHQRNQEELAKLAGLLTAVRPNKIEELAIRKTPALRYFLSDVFDRVMAEKKALPKNKLIPIVELLAAISAQSGGRVATPELACAFGDVYDGNRVMIYRLDKRWLCNPINDGTAAGFNQRVDIACNFTNCCDRLDSEFDQYLISEADAVDVAKQLWDKFYDESLNDPFVSLGFATMHADSKSLNERGLPKGVTVQTEIDPSDSPLELDAANMAFRAITNGYGDQSATPRNRLIHYLETHFSDFKAEQVQRIATVANPDKTTGRKRSGKE